MKLKLNKKGWMIISTLIVISFIFIYYFLIYVGNQESEMIRNSLRVLTRMEDNFYGLEESYRKNAKVASNSTEKNPILKEFKNAPVDFRSESETFFHESRLVIKIPKNDSTGQEPKYYYVELEDIFSIPIMQRQDVFEFISLHDNSKDEILYSNNKIGDVHFNKDVVDTLAVYQKDLGYDDFYVFSTKLDNHQNLFLSGFINQKKFNAQKRKVPLGLIILSTIAVILVILCLPLLKLKVMSNVERLYISDVLFSGTSLIFIPAILLLLTIGAISYFYTSKESVKKDLVKFSNQIESNFEDELQLIVDQLNLVKFATKNVETLEHFEHQWNTILKPDEEETAINYNDNEKIEAIGYKKVNMKTFFSKFNYFNGIFWTDQNSTLVSILSLKDKISLGINLDHRLYITNVINDELIPFGKDSIAFESIRSVNDGSFEMGVGMRSGIESMPVLALSAPIQSLMQPAVKNGWGFCIIDENGNTLFHSDISKNLNENFLEETNHGISNYFNTNSEEFHETNYNGLNQYLYGRPMGTFSDYHIITFVDKQYVHTKSTIALYTTLALYIVYLVILAGIYSIIYLLNVRSTKLKQLVFPLNWIRPFDRPLHRRLYKYLLLLNLSGIAYLFLTTLAWIELEEFVLNSMVLSTFVLVVVNFHVLSINLPRQKRIFTIYYSRNSNVLTPIVVLVGILLFMMLYYRSSWWFEAPVLFAWDIILLFILFVLPLAGIWLNRNERIPDFIRKPIIRLRDVLQGRRAIFKGYKAYLLSWSVLLSLLPIFILYSITSQKEREIYFKQAAFDYHQSKQQWVDKKLEPYQDLLKDRDNRNYIKKLINEGINDDLYNYVEGFSEADELDSKHRKDTSISSFEKLYSVIRVPLNEYGSKTRGFVKSNHRTSWSYHTGMMCYFNPKGGRTGHYTTPISKIWLGDGETNANLTHVIVAILLISLVMVSLITFVVHRVYGLDFKKAYERLTFKGPEEFKKIFLGDPSEEPNEVSQGAVTEPIVNQLLFSENHSRPVNSYKNTIIVGVNASHISIVKHGFQSLKDPGYTFLLMDMYDVDFLSKEFNDETHQKECLKKILKNSKNKGEAITLLLETLFEPSNTDDEKFVIFIEHFEFAYNDPQLNKVKLKLLERLVDHDCIAVNLSSEINPNNIYEYYQQEIRRMESALDNNKDISDSWLELRDTLQEFRVDYKKWLNLLGSFTKVTLPLQMYARDIDKDEENVRLRDALKVKVNDLFKRETSNGNYLFNLRPYFEGLYEINQNKSDYSWVHEDYIIKVQETSYSYYFSIWNSLSKEERYIVYDICKDKFVNTNNTDGILDLLNKGILIYDHSLRLMNESFSNFILSKVNSDEALAKELETRKEGSWSRASAILILIIVALIVFISFGQLSVLNDINSLIGSLAAMFTLFLRVSGFGLKKS